MIIRKGIFVFLIFFVKYVFFRAYEDCEYSVRVSIFGRLIKDYPFVVNVSCHHCPKWQFGSQGIADEQLNQPVKICQDAKGLIYILDTGNNRRCSTVGMALLNHNGDIVTLNWKTKELYKCGRGGELLQVFFLLFSSD
ncbi:unnamed protein product [Gongylonema pulchrum]|uniref:Uncharacterized protein n=1 Tax=Gongylonema pulchrum TaxID=637853 RepID=A0A3P6RP17_9BILA|nr:unnamed protein product [Gongylonema pulchrum]